MQMMVMEETAMGIKNFVQRESIFSAIEMAYTECDEGMARCVPKSKWLYACKLQSPLSYHAFEAEFLKLKRKIS